MSEKRNSVSQNIPTIASGSAVLLTIGTGIYFYQRIGEVDTKIIKIEENLAKIIPLVDPKIGHNVNQCIAGFHALSERLERLQAQVNLLIGKTNTPVIISEPIPVKPVPVSEPSVSQVPSRQSDVPQHPTQPAKEVKKYVRLTTPKKAPDEEEDPEIAAAIAAMNV